MAEKKTRRPKGEGSIFPPDPAKGKNNWVARIPYTKADGTKGRKTFEGKTKNEALQKRNQWLLSHKMGTVAEGTREKEYFDAYIMDWLHNVKKGSVAPDSFERNLRAIEKHVIPYIGNIRLINLDTATIQTQIINRLRDAKKEDGSYSYTYNTILKIFDPLRSCLKYAAKVGHITSNPCDNVVLPKERDSKQISPLSADEAKAFLSECQNPDPQHKTEYSWVYQLMLYTGLREGEACALRPQDVNLTEQYLDVHATIVANIDAETGKRASGYIYQDHTKTKRGRHAYFGDDAKALLEERLKTCPVGCYLANQSTTPVNLVYLGRQFKKVCKYAGIEKNYTLHDLRHTCATLLIRNGNDARTVADQLGHSTVKTTLTFYVHPSGEDRKKAMKGLKF